MRVLWITNIQMPEVCLALGKKPTVFGGWLMGSADFLSKHSDVELAIATVYQGSELWFKEINGIKYFLLPVKTRMGKYPTAMEKFWINVKNTFHPDIVHIHGSEFPYGLAYVNACGGKNVVLSIQGMTSVYADYYYAGINRWNILKNITIYDLFRGQTLFKGHQDFVNSGENEKILIKKIGHVIGRTSWDRMHAKSINSNITYHFCNETLRKSFYNDSWNYDACIKHSIFVPQAWYPIKGLHQVLRALSIVKKNYPDVSLRIAGTDLTLHETLKQRLKMSGYGKILLNEIISLNLSENICFTGILDEDHMKQEYLKANVFVCPSAIENSPNSLGEAQILGTPTISAFVGGVADMIEHEVTGFLYRFEDVEMLAGYICDVFALGENIQSYCQKGKQSAFERHDGNANNDTLLKIYNHIVYAK